MFLAGRPKRSEAVVEPRRHDELRPALVQAILLEGSTLDDPKYVSGTSWMMSMVTKYVIEASS